MWWSSITPAMQSQSKYLAFFFSFVPKNGRKRQCFVALLHDTFWKAKCRCLWIFVIVLAFFLSTARFYDLMPRHYPYGTLLSFNCCFNCF